MNTSLRPIALVLIFSAILLACSQSSKTVVNNRLGKPSYTSTLLVVPYNANYAGAKNFARLLRSEFQVHADTMHKKVEVINFPTEGGQITLDPEDELNLEIARLIEANGYDAVITINPIGVHESSAKYYYSNRYEVVVTDVASGKECWIGELEHRFLKFSGTRSLPFKIMKRLIDDKVI